MKIVDNRESHAVASILGGAIGDALGITKELFPKSETADGVHIDVLPQRVSFQAIQRDYEGGGPWQKQWLSLEPGEWTDDTAMMLCLADSLLCRKSLIVGDLMERFNGGHPTTEIRNYTANTAIPF